MWVYKNYMEYVEALEAKELENLKQQFASPNLWVEMNQQKNERVQEPEMCPCNCGMTVEEAEKDAEDYRNRQGKYATQQSTYPEINVDEYDQVETVDTVEIVVNVVNNQEMDKETFVMFVNAVEQNMDALQDVKQLVYNQDGHTCTYDHLPNTIINYLDEAMQTDLVSVYFFELELEIGSAEELYDFILASRKCTCDG